MSRAHFTSWSIATLTFIALVGSAYAQEEADVPGDGETPAEGLEPGLYPPELVESADPEFPADAYSNEIEADVIFLLDVAETGEITQAVPQQLIVYTYDEEGYLIETPTPLDEDPYGFVEAATAVITQYEFSPAINVDEDHPEGVPVPVQITWRTSFTIDWETYTRVVEDEDYAEAEGAGTVAIDPEGPVNFGGRLLKRGTREPLAGFLVTAELELDDGSVLTATALSDEDGNFEMNGLPTGEWNVVINEIGFFLVETTEEISRTELTEITYYVEENVYGENVSTTTSTRPRREVTRRSIQIEETQRIAGINNDAIKVVQNLPGVARASFGGGDVIIRGSAPEDTQFLVDGMQIPAVYHFGGLRAVFPSELLSEISFLPGAYSAYYGRATGGVVEVITRQEQPDMVHGHVDVNVFDTGIWLDAPLSENLSIQFGARRSYIDAILTPLSDVIGLNFATAPRYYDGQLRLLWDIDERNRFSFFTYTSDDLIDFVLEDETDIEPEQRGGIRARSYFTGAIARWESEISDTLKNTIAIQYFRQGLNFALGQDLFFRLKTNDHAYRETLEWTPSDRFYLRTGMDIRVTPGDIAVRLPLPPAEGEEPLNFEALEVRETRQDLALYQPAAYVEAEIRPVDQLQLLPGFRADYFRPPERWGLDPRFAIRYGINDLWTVKAATGLFHQAPTPQESAEDFGNPNLRLEQAIHYVTGFEYNDLETGRFANVELFYKDLNDLVAPDDGTRETDDGETVSQNYNNAGEGRIYGAEILLRQNLTNRFFGWIAYTISRSERLDPGESEYRLFDFDQTHILTILGSYQLPRNWSIGARFRLVTGNPTTPIIGSFYDSANNTFIRVAGETNSVRTKTFHQFDFRVDKRWIYNRWTLNLYLDIQNVYNRMNQEDVAYNYDFTEQDDITGLPIIPSLGIRAEF